MVRNDNTNRTTAIRVLGEIQNRVNVINLALKENDNDEGKLDATYVSGRNAVAIAAGQEIVGLARWFMENANQLNQTPQAAYDDATVDGINIDIRTTEDGL
jgi:hypothetical protein